MNPLTTANQQNNNSDNQQQKQKIDAQLPLPQDLYMQQMMQQQQFYQANPQLQQQQQQLPMTMPQTLDPYQYQMQMQLMYQQLAMQGIDPSAMFMGPHGAMAASQLLGHTTAVMPAQTSNKRKSAGGQSQAKKIKKIVYTGDEPEMNPELHPKDLVWMVYGTKGEQWPGQLLNIDDYAQLAEYERRENHVLVHLFSTLEYCYVPKQNVSAFLLQHPNYRERTKRSRAKLFLKALTDARGFMGEMPASNDSQEDLQQQQDPDRVRQHQVIPENWEFGPDVSQLKVYNVDGELIQGEAFKLRLMPSKAKVSVPAKSNGNSALAASKVAQIHNELEAPEVEQQSTELIKEHVNFKPLRRAVNDASAKTKKRREKKLQVLKRLGLVAIV